MEDKKKMLEKELKYLTKEAKTYELNNYANILNESSDVKKIAEEIYLKRGLDIKQINRGIFNNFGNELSKFFDSFKNKEKSVKRNMILDIIYLVLIIIFIKVPFELVKDIGYEYIEVITTNELFFTIWNLVFLLLYTLTALATFIILVRNYNNKYSNK